MPGTYLNSVYDLRPLAYVEPGYGYPESGQTVINVTNGKLIRLLVDDEPFDIRYGRLTGHERILDLRAGTLERRAEWTSPAGQMVRVTSVRLVSFTQRSVAAISYEVEPVGNAARIVVQSELIANEPLPAPPFTTDPRGTAAMEAPLLSEDDRWALAYYVVSLSAFKDPLTLQLLPLSPADRAALNDPKLEAPTPEDAYVPGGGRTQRAEASGAATGGPERVPVSASGSASPLKKE